MTIWTLEGLKKGRKSAPWPPANLHGAKGLPVPEAGSCPAGCSDCIESCPTDAISCTQTLAIDHGACTGCGICVFTCSDRILKFSSALSVAADSRDALLVSKGARPAISSSRVMNWPLRRSLFIRHVDAGSCNGCESELGALDSPYYNLHRFGFSFTPSPRFADILLVTGTVTYPMIEPLRETYRAMPDPKFVIATGVCAISGGSNGGGYNSHSGLVGIVPVDLWIPGCPPHPVTVIQALLEFTGRGKR